MLNHFYLNSLVSSHWEPLVVTIASLLSGEPASCSIFKGLGAALGGALGTFIPIPILGTLIGETIGVFVGDLLYELLMGKGIEGVGQKLKDTFTTLQGRKDGGRLGWWRN